MGHCVCVRYEHDTEHERYDNVETFAVRRGLTDMAEAQRLADAMTNVGGIVFQVHLSEFLETNNW